MTSVFQLMVRTQLTRGRIAALSIVALVGAFIGFAIGVNGGDGSDFVDAYGLGLIVPITALVFASSAFNDPVEDGTLVYLWLRPVARWKITLATLAATFAVAVPFAVVPTVVAAGLTRSGRELPLGALVAGAIATMAYCTLFLFLGLVVRRALVWGLAYVLIWEGFVARSGTAAARLSILGYARSLMAEIADTDPPRLAASLGASIAVPVIVAACAVALTIAALRRVDVR